MYYMSNILSILIYTTYFSIFIDFHEHVARPDSPPPPPTCVCNRLDQESLVLVGQETIIPIVVATVCIGCQ